MGLMSVACTLVGMFGSLDIQLVGIFDCIDVTFLRVSMAL